MRKIYFLLFFVWINTFIFSAEDNLRQQFLTMTIGQAHEKYGDGKLVLDTNAWYSEQTQKAKGIIGKQNDTKEYRILLNTLHMIASDFEQQSFFYDVKFAQEDISDLPIQQFIIMPLAYDESHILSRQKLDLFANLPEPLHKKISSYYYLDEKPKSFYSWDSDSDHRIKIQYRKKLTPFLIAKETLLHSGLIPSLCVTIGSLLHTYFVTKPIWDKITGTSDPAILAQNAEWEITNALIDNLQKNGVAGSQNLHKLLLNNPLKYTQSDYLHFFKPLLPASFLLSCLMGYDAYYGTKEGNEKLGQKKSPIKEAFLDSVLFVPFSLILSSMISIVSYGLIPTEEIDTMATYLNYVRITIVTLLFTWILYDNILSTIEKLSQWQSQSIDFEETKTVKECIDKYLNDPSIEIRDF